MFSTIFGFSKYGGALVIPGFELPVVPFFVDVSQSLGF